MRAISSAGSYLTPLKIPEAEPASGKSCQLWWRRFKAISRPGWSGREDWLTDERVRWIRYLSCFPISEAGRCTTVVWAVYISEDRRSGLFLVYAIFCILLNERTNKWWLLSKVNLWLIECMKHRFCIYLLVRHHGTFYEAEIHWLATTCAHTHIYIYIMWGL